MTETLAEAIARHEKEISYEEGLDVIFLGGCFLYRETY